MGGKKRLFEVLKSFKILLKERFKKVMIGFSIARKNIVSNDIISYIVMTIYAFQLNDIQFRMC